MNYGKVVILILGPMGIASKWNNKKMFFGIHDHLMYGCGTGVEDEDFASFVIFKVRSRF